MSTKTMHLPPRRNKRKERDDFDAIKPSPPKLARPNAVQAGFAKPASGAELEKPNFLLAGYLAHEFLLRGTLFGQPWDPARAEPSAPALKPAGGGAAAEPAEQQRRRYVEVAGLLGSGGSHLPGIVNPTQLARFLHM